MLRVVFAAAVVAILAVAVSDDRAGAYCVGDGGHEVTNNMPINLKCIWDAIDKSVTFSKCKADSHNLTISRL